MRQCPENANPLTCGLAAAQYLAEEPHIELQPQDKTNPLKVDEFGKLLLKEVLTPLAVTSNGIYDASYFECRFCKRCIRISNERSKLSAELTD